MQMDKSIVRFLQNKNGQNESHTHVSLITPKGNWDIQRKNTDEFWNLYCETFYNNKDFISGLGEKPGKFITPILNDTDIKLPYNIKSHDLKKPLYNRTHITRVIKIYQDVLKEIINDYKPRYGICFLLEKDLPTLKDGMISHGFHLHFPYTFMSKIDQSIHLIPRIRKKVFEQKVFEDLDMKDEPTINKIIDETYNKHWLMYGSRKSVDRPYYKLSKIYNDVQKEISLKTALQEYVLRDTNDNIIDFTKPNIDYHLPRILSIDPENKDVIDLIPTLQILPNKKIQKAKDKKQVTEISVSEAMIRTKKLMTLISPSRADNYHDWIEMGWILYCVGDGCEEALNLWIDFSSKAINQSNFSEKRCMYLWNNEMKNRGKTIASLYDLAKKDSPEQYEIIKKEEEIKLFKENIKIGGHCHYDIAMWLKERFMNLFKCYDVDKGHWFRYEQHRWVYDQKGITLTKKIPTILVEQLKIKQEQIENYMKENEDGINPNNVQYKAINKLIAGCKSTPFIKSVMEACKIIFYDENFVELLDTNSNLIHFTNGVLDLKQKRLRDGNPDDCLSLTTGYEYKEFDIDSPEVAMVDEHLSKVFPDPLLKQYFIEYCAMLLKGGNKSKTFLVSSGTGDNAKSVNMELLKLVLGKYMKVLPTAVITGKRGQSSGATPEFDEITGVRLAILQEPEGRDVINIGILKELTGNDSLYIRGLYKKAQNVVPQFKLMLICITGDAKINMDCGITYNLENLKNIKDKVYCWDEKQKCITSSSVTNFYNQGMKQCIKLTFCDGRTLTCTPDHKLLTYNGWIEAQHIKKYESQVIMGMSLTDGNDIFTSDDDLSIEDRLKESNRYRLLGYENKELPNLNVSKYLIREFLGGLFGGDNCVINCYPGFSTIRYKLKDDEQSETENKLKSLLLKFDVECEILKNSKGKFLNIVSINNFINNIGVRYNIEKMYKLTTAKCILNYQSAIKIQTEKIKKEIDKLVNELHIDPWQAQRIAYDNCEYLYDKSYNPNLLAFLDRSKLLNFCNYFPTEKIPYFLYTVVKSENVGEQIVYDITVDNHHSFIANGVVVHNCNALPRLPYDDPATWNRIRVLYHEATFPKNNKLVPATMEEQYAKKIFPRDEYFNEKLPFMRDAMMWLMFYTYCQIEKTQRMEEPEKVKQATLMYRENNDVFYQFIKEKIIEDHEIENGEEASISIQEAFTCFREWFKSSFPGFDCPNKNQMKQDLVQKWGELSYNRKWVGYRLREEKDDIREGNAFVLDEKDLVIDPSKIKNVAVDESIKDKSQDKDLCIDIESEEEVTHFRSKVRKSQKIIDREQKLKDKVLNKRNSISLSSSSSDDDEDDFPLIKSPKESICDESESEDEESSSEDEQSETETEESKVEDSKLEESKIESSSEEESSEESEDDE